MGIIKICISCTKEYESRAVTKYRRGTCRPCQNKKIRTIYAQKRVESGEGYCEFEELLSRGFKKCTKCMEVKPLDLFSKSKTKCGYRVGCKMCDSKLYKKYEGANRDKINENRRNRRKDPERGIIFSLRNRQQSFFKGGKRNKGRATTALIREWMGCSVADCKIHLEKQFKEGMSWSNRGMGLDKWQIDHKIPICLTELGKGEMLDTPLNRRIWHYKNLQPLWHSDNAKKSKSLIHLNDFYEPDT